MTDPLNDPVFINGRPMYVSRTGEPMSFRQWAAAFSDIEGRTLGRTTIGDSLVMTMWMGLDSDPSRPVPLIFGSIIKCGGGFSDELETATEPEAMQAHQMLVDLVHFRQLTGALDVEGASGTDEGGDE